MLTNRSKIREDKTDGCPAIIFLVRVGVFLGGCSGTNYASAGGRAGCSNSGAGGSAIDVIHDGIRGWHGYSREIYAGRQSDIACSVVDKCSRRHRVFRSAHA